MKKLVKVQGLFWAMLLLSTLTACYFQPVENLYHLPQQSIEYEQLISEISKIRSALEQSNPGVEYANILAGDNTATIQLHNLGNSGEVDTAITFFRVPGAENPIKIYIFTLDIHGNYGVNAMIEGQGTSILSVDYSQLNGIGKKEILINWQNNVLGVYTMDSNPALTLDPQQTLLPQIPEVTQLLTTTHNNYAIWDMDKSDVDNLLVVRLDIAGVNSFVEMYHWNEGALETHSIAPISANITSLSNLRTNYITGNLPALYISSNLVDNSRTTDILVLTQDRLTNLTIDSETGISSQTLRDYYDIGPTDINNDGILEIPNPVPLPTYSEDDTATPTTTFWLIDWTQYNSRGNASAVFTTYHNLADGWYFIIPNHWKDQISVSRDDSILGQRTVIFSRWNEAGSAPTPFLAIYQLTGPNRYTRVALPDRFELGGDSITFYAAAFMNDSWDCGLDNQDVIQSFYQIISSWA